ncbi:MAG TPA: FAD-binding oxidoreductase [Candidatus Limnocylindrales bacterium]|nr:FAD-binding oxidoreductase [Candidatus Limnocylindrales bacterium]
MLSGWGRYPVASATELEDPDLEKITDGAVLTRGLGRSYGDASLPPAGRGPVASSLRADRVLSFDERSGVLRAEAGLRLDRLIEMFLPRGFFVPVTPGTRYVTLGGMVAADVHGKNHHAAGTIGAHVRSIRMRFPDGRVEDVTGETHPEIFWATLGGMGLTGHILDVTLVLERVPSSSIIGTSRTFVDLESLIDALEDASHRWPFTVAWSDLMARGGSFGRGILFYGRWASPEQAALIHHRELPRVVVPRRVPATFLSNATIRAYNALRYNLARQSHARDGADGTVGSALSFFYPLDIVENWNVLYGRGGLTQYQCVLPRDATMRSYRRIVDIAGSGGPGPFLAVIKDYGAEGKGMLSFPMPGISFALDFPIHAGTAALVSRLNEAVIDAGGRIYLAKDAFTTAEQFARMESRLERFLDVRRRIDPDGTIASGLSQRLFPDRRAS